MSTTDKQMLTSVLYSFVFHFYMYQKTLSFVPWSQSTSIIRDPDAKDGKYNIRGYVRFEDCTYKLRDKQFTYYSMTNSSYIIYICTVSYL